MDVLALEHLLKDNATTEILIVALSYIIKAVVRPSKVEAKVLARFLTFVAIFLINVLKRWYKKHPVALTKSLDELYEHVFHSRHYFIKEENAKMIIG